MISDVHLQTFIADKVSILLTHDLYFPFTGCGEWRNLPT